MAPSSVDVPERVSWAVDLLDVGPHDQILELGCGPGVAVRLICERLNGGQITAIDRSATAIHRATARNAEHLAAGRAVLQQSQIADLRGEAARFDKVLAINVNAFWTSSADLECQALVHVLRPGGAVHLVYAGPGPDGARDVGPGIADKLERHGFAAEVIGSETGSMTCITGRLTT